MRLRRLCGVMLGLLSLLLGVEGTDGQRFTQMPLRLYFVDQRDQKGPHVTQLAWQDTVIRFHHHGLHSWALQPFCTLRVELIQIVQGDGIGFQLHRHLEVG